MPHTFSSSVVGVSFRGAQVREVVKNQLNVGDQLQLVADPENEYDDTAVAVYYDDLHIGFIPRGENQQLFKALTEGGEAFAEITMFENSIKPLVDVTIL